MVKEFNTQLPRAALAATYLYAVLGQHVNKPVRIGHSFLQTHAELPDDSKTTEPAPTNKNKFSTANKFLLAALSASCATATAMESEFGTCAESFNWKILDGSLQVILSDDLPVSYKSELMEGWREAKTSDGKTYYWNIDPNIKTTFERPTKLDDTQATFVLDGNWLRERCLASFHVDVDSRQPFVDAHEIADVSVKKVQSNDSTLNITFSDNLSCEFGSKSLVHELTQERHGDIQAGLYVQFPDMFMWDGSLAAAPEYDFDAIVNDHSSDVSAFRGLTNILLTTGLAIVKNVPMEDGFCRNFGQNISTSRDTEWGDVFNVRTTPDTQAGQAGGAKKDLAYTGAGIGLHTDNPYRQPMPDFQILHQIEGCDCGDDPLPCDTCGTENFFVDGIYVASKLKEEDPEAFELLSTIEVRWENNGGDGNGYIMTNKPIIELHSYGGGAPCIWYPNCIEGIRFSAKSGGYAPVLPPDVSKKFYAARRKFSEMIAAPENRITMYLKPGQLVVFDNRRILHARGTVVTPPGVGRWLQGCYVNRDGLWLGFARAFHERSNWNSLATANKSDYETMGELYKKHVDDEMLNTFRTMMEAQIGKTLGQPVDLYEHGLQVASRAYRGGEDEDTVVMSLFHDMTETIVSKNHGVAVAGFLEPYLNPKVIWMLRKHEIFQGYYYFHYFGGNREERDRYKDHEHYDTLVRWCHEYDQAGFDPGYPSLPFDFFVPMIKRVFEREPFWWDPNHPGKSAVTG